MSNGIAHLAFTGGRRIQVGYSKSNRSSCKQCRKGIQKDALRVGQLTGSPTEGIGPKWCHPSCFLDFIKGCFAKPEEWFKKYVPDAEQIPGIESLTPDDKAIITDLVALGRNPMRYVVTVTESREASGEIQLVCTNMNGDAVCPNLRPDTKANVRRHVAQHVGRRETEVELVNADGSLFDGASGPSRGAKRKAPGSDSRAALLASAGGA
ncbi:PARP1 [Symbiodinium natans]|uniref:PARP1 protein n=1 Tax=Symbiodinium natans TaxID=878477 RepID=A0A812HGB1_9DINO|nr:PARP1 [Symbiodinium natans]